MNNLSISNIINDFDTIEKNNLSKLFNIPQKKEESFNEERISYKLTLRKQKLEQKIIRKRILKSNNLIIFNKDLTPIIYKKEDFLTGKVYDDLNNTYNSKNENELKNIIYGLTLFLRDEKINNIEFIDIFKKTDSSYNIKNNIKNHLFPLGMLLLKIGLNSYDKSIYFYSFNLVFNLTFISNDFCQEITNEIIITEIIEKLKTFYIHFEKNEKTNKNNNTAGDIGKTESYYFASNILKLLGNLFLSSDKYGIFEALNFYNKIFNLLSVFKLYHDNEVELSILYDYLYTLIWLIIIFFEKVENLSIKFYDILINIIPNLLNYVRALYYTNETELLDKILCLMEYLSDINDIFLQKIVELDGIKILFNLFGYLFISYKDNGEIKLTSEITDRIIIIIANIFTIESKYVINVDFTQFIIVFEKIFSIYKVHHSNHYDIQSHLLLVLSNLACFNDIEDIIFKILMNNKIISDLFNYYYKYHKKEILIFIDNIIVKQHKKVRDYILSRGAFDIIKNCICEFDGDKNGLIKESTMALYDLIKAERAFNIRLLFEKIYNTSIPEKIKEIIFNNDLPKNIEEVMKNIIIDFENYEKSLEI